jgi:hypothetical protein
MGHALVREFDVPILGNEETLADAFATHYLTTYLRDRALAVLDARVRSLMIEASEVPRARWTVKDGARPCATAGRLALASHASVRPRRRRRRLDSVQTDDHGSQPVIQRFPDQGAKRSSCRRAVVEASIVGWT